MDVSLSRERKNLSTLMDVAVCGEFLFPSAWDGALKKVQEHGVVLRMD